MIKENPELKGIRTCHSRLTVFEIVILLISFSLPVHSQLRRRPRN
jgi:hypothetical protein